MIMGGLKGIQIGSLPSGVVGSDATFSGVVTALEFISTQASGSVGFLMNTAGARLKLSSGGTTDYLISDGGTNVSTPGNFSALTLASTGTNNLSGGTPLNLTSATGSVFFNNTAATAGIIFSGVSAANAGAAATTAAVKIEPINVLDATDWLFSANTQSSANSVFNVAYNGTTQTTMGTAGNLVTMGGIASAITADVTSSGAGSNLISYTLPANALVTTNRGLRITGWGTTLNNANAKTVSLAFGGQTIISKQLAVSLANGSWKLTAIVLRSGASTQDIYAEGWNEDAIAVSGTDGPTILYAATRTAGTQTETATIVIKGVATTATTTDITMDGLIVEYI